MASIASTSKTSLAKVKKSGSQADTSGALTPLPNREILDSDESGSSQGITNADSLNASNEIWLNADLEILQRKAGLLAGALRDFQTAGGIVVLQQVEYLPGRFGLDLLILASGTSIKTVQTDDGLDIIVTATR